MATLEETRSEVKRPPDFAEFWRHTKTCWRRRRWSGNGCRTRRRRRPALTVDWLKFPSLHGRTVYGWLAVPHVTAPAAMPGISGCRGTHWATRRRGRKPVPEHGHARPEPARQPAGHALCPPVHAGQGIHHAGHRVAGDVYLSGTSSATACARWTCWRRSRKWTADRLIVGGMSQGGGLALVTAALASDQVRAVPRGHALAVRPGPGAVAD